MKNSDNITVILDVDINIVKGPVYYHHIFDHNSDLDIVGSHPNQMAMMSEKYETEVITGSPIVFPGKGEVLIGMTKLAKEKLGDIIGALSAQAQRIQEVQSHVQFAKSELLKKELAMNKVRKAMRRMSYRDRIKSAKILKDLS